MIKKTIEEWSIDKRKCFMVADIKTDLLASKISMLKFICINQNKFYKQIEQLI